MRKPLIVIFGAAVRPDGGPSDALARRVGYGLDAARLHPGAPVLCSGAVGRHPPSEAAVMALALRDAGVDPDRLVLDEASRDTLQSVLAAARLAEEGPHDGIIACSDGYHLPRIRMMLALMGVSTAPSWAPPGARGRRLWRMAAREALAIPYDLVLVALKGRIFPKWR